MPDDMNKCYLGKLSTLDFAMGVSKLPERVQPGDIVCTIFAPKIMLGVVVEYTFLQKSIQSFEPATDATRCVVLKHNGELMQRIRIDCLQIYTGDTNEQRTDGADC